MLPSKVVSETEDSELTVAEKKKKNLKFSLTVTAIGIAVVAICLVVFFTVLGGTISFGK